MVLAANAVETGAAKCTLATLKALASKLRSAAAGDDGLGPPFAASLAKVAAIGRSAALEAAPAVLQLLRTLLKVPGGRSAVMAAAGGADAASALLGSLAQQEALKAVADECSQLLSW